MTAEMKKETLRRENEELRHRLAEAEDALLAIQAGQVDAIVVDGAAGAQIFSLSGAETVYRLTVETMAEAAINVAADGTIVFCNARFSAFVATSTERLLGRDIAGFVPPEDRDAFRALLRRCCTQPVKQRIVFCGPGGVRTPVLLSGNALSQGDSVSLCLVAADLTELESAAYQIEHLRERHVRLQQEIVDREWAEETLRLADRRKSEFLATLAHELRNPLAPIRTGLDLIRALRGDAAACERPLQIMDRQLTHLVRLVDDLLDVSRISRGKIDLRKERLDLAEIVEAALEISESGIGRDDRRLSVSLPSRPLPVEGDRVRLVQIISNLLNNAAKFTDEGGRIELGLVPCGERVEIRVSDDGQGIPRERLSDLFEIFSQIDTGRGGGLGIGLTLVRSLVAMHGGTVCADSEGLGRGATFTVSLPLCADVAQQPMPREAPQADPVPRRRVLVVDDNPDVAESLHLLLTVLDAEVRVAHDGADAISVCAEWTPTHILMDLGMPGMDGYEAARRLRADHPDGAFRLVAISGWGQDEHRQKAREAGFDRHLIKPVAVAELKAILLE
ncbi:MAG: response regulator [Thiohalocapsa sp.]|nr:response regulator [Thiohalocapsa sp.]